MGSQLWEVTRKSKINNRGWLCQLKSLPSPVGKFVEIWSSSSSGYSKGDILTNGGFPYKCKCFLLQKINSFQVFSFFSLSAVF